MTDLSERDKLLLYRSSDVYFSPSDTVQESFGMSLTEAMACGLPLIVSDWNGYKDVLIHGITGFKVPTR